jgi:candicidin polyketide synthase FscE
MSSSEQELLKKAAIRIKQLQTRLQERTQPIAIIGLACRFPGAKDKDAFWRLLIDRTDAISEVPRARWDVDAYYDPDPEAPGKMSSRYGGFIDGIDQFDPAFFAITPREAVDVDPQQRLLLEISWQALEDAGIDLQRLADNRVGVYAGISTNDYWQLISRGGVEAVGPYVGTGVAHSVAVGRVSFALSLQGPSLAVDTACSSSLVALHQACRGLLNGECELAIAGGVNAILTPEATIYFSKGRFMAPDGRCKTFDAKADGYVRSEGCGMVVLKRLSDAQRDGDRIYAVVYGSAVNQDGRSSGLTVPNGPAQERVIADALAWAQLDPGTVSYVEAHGTGTALGDPIEIQALHNALGRSRPKGQPLLVGSVKTNIGHLEAAAGIASVIKVALALQYGVIPGQLHFKTPSPRIDWDGVNVRVVTAETTWPEDRPLAGISGFAFQGTNAHVVLGTAPVPATVPTAEPRDRVRHVLPLSGKTAPALRELAGRYADWIGRCPDADLADLCFTAGVGRGHFEHRAAVVAETPVQLRAALDQLAVGQTPPASFIGHARTRPRLAMLFPGQSSQYAGMARELYDLQPLFRHTLDRCAAVLEPELDRPLLEVLFGQGTGAAALSNGRLMPSWTAWRRTGSSKGCRRSASTGGRGPGAGWPAPPPYAPGMRLRASPLSSQLRLTRRCKRRSVPAHPRSPSSRQTGAVWGRLSGLDVLEFWSTWLPPPRRFCGTTVGCSNNYGALRLPSDRWYYKPRWGGCYNRSSSCPTRQTRPRGSWTWAWTH